MRKVIKLIEYPHCADCNEHYYCFKQKLSLYRPKFLKIDKSCYEECPYDMRCKKEAVFECSQYCTWCEEDLKVAKEQNFNAGCYSPPKKSIFKQLQEKIRKILEG